jgi:predicted GIY-YIG superfamily endonuclease
VIATDERPTAVYRFYDSAGQLLYVGITFDIGPRFASHARKASWWCDQHSAVVVWRGTRAEAADEERKAIRGERPLHNISGTRVSRTRVRRMRPDALTRQAIALEVRVEVARSGKSKREVREFLGLSRQSAWMRMIGQISFTGEELHALAGYLGIPVDRFRPQGSEGVLEAFEMFETLTGGTA